MTLGCVLCTALTDSTLSSKAGMITIGTLNPFPNKPWLLRVCSTGF